MPYFVKIAGKSARVTTNLRDILITCLGTPLESLDDKRGREVYDIVWPAVAMAYHPDEESRLIKMEAKNGHGTLNDARKFLVDLMDLSTNHVDFKFEVSVDTQ